MNLGITMLILNLSIIMEECSCKCIFPVLWILPIFGKLKSLKLDVYQQDLNLYCMKQDLPQRKHLSHLIKKPKQTK
jgi:hypothetical protein